jgi:hypothetical protein
MISRKGKKMLMKYFMSIFNFYVFVSIDRPGFTALQQLIQVAWPLGL